MSKCQLGTVLIWVRKEDDRGARVLEDHGVVACCADGEWPAVGTLVKCGDESDWMWSVLGRSCAWWIDPCLLLHTPSICVEGRQIAGK